MAKRRIRKPQQLELDLCTWGGAREGAGRPRVRARESVPHVVRTIARAAHPLLITMRVREDVPSLRTPASWSAIVAALQAFRECTPLSFVHISVMRNHLHFVAECDDGEQLGRSMQAFATRLGKALNRATARRGSVFDGRYHARELATPTEVRNALRYVLLNARHHAHDAGVRLPAGWIDPYSSARGFDGWRIPLRRSSPLTDIGMAPARGWLLRVGWRTGGPIDIDDTPGTKRSHPTQRTARMSAESSAAA